MKIVVGPLDEVPRLCSAHRPSHLVSWLSPLDAGADIPATCAPERHLRLSSHDICDVAEGLESPCADHLAELLAFAGDWRGERPMLVHCWAGVSRSTAAAFAIACQARPELPEAELARRLRVASSTATPNRLIVSLADELLQRGGRMTAAVAAIGRGAEAGLGVPFVLDLAGQATS